MKRWFYIVGVQDDFGWWNTAIQACRVEDARATFARQYPAARIHSIEV